MRDAAGGDPGAIRKQLDRASELIEQTRFEQPIVKVALMRQTAGRYAELGDIGRAPTCFARRSPSIAGTELAAADAAACRSTWRARSRATCTRWTTCRARARELDRADA